MFADPVEPGGRGLSLRHLACLELYNTALTFTKKDEITHTRNFRTKSYIKVQCSTVHLSTVQYSAVQYTPVQYSTVQYSTPQYSTVHPSTVQYSAVQNTLVQYSTVQFSTPQYSTVQCSTVHLSTVQYSTNSLISSKTIITNTLDTYITNNTNLFQYFQVFHY